jgi:hypothetical protein
MLFEPNFVKDTVGFAIFTRLRCAIRTFSVTECSRTVLRCFGTGNDLFNKATALVCNRLMTLWKSELNSALAAMEVLSALARVKLVEPSRAMCKRAVNWICEFVAFQCSRPPQSHSKVRLTLVSGLCKNKRGEVLLRLNLI